MAVGHRILSCSPSAAATASSSCSSSSVIHETVTFASLNGIRRPRRCAAAPPRLAYGPGFMTRHVHTPSSCSMRYLSTFSTSSWDASSASSSSSSATSPPPWSDTDTSSHQGRSSAASIMHLTTTSPTRTGPAAGIGTRRTRDLFDAFWDVNEDITWRGGDHRPPVRWEQRVGPEPAAVRQNSTTGPAHHSEVFFPQAQAAGVKGSGGRRLGSSSVPTARELFHRTSLDMDVAQRRFDAQVRENDELAAERLVIPTPGFDVLQFPRFPPFYSAEAQRAWADVSESDALRLMVERRWSSSDHFGWRAQLSWSGRGRRRGRRGALFWRGAGPSQWHTGRSVSYHHPSTAPVTVPWLTLRPPPPPWPQHPHAAAPVTTTAAAAAAGTDTGGTGGTGGDAVAAVPPAPLYFFAPSFTNVDHRSSSSSSFSSSSTAANASSPFPHGTPQWSPPPPPPQVLMNAAFRHAQEEWRRWQPAFQQHLSELRSWRWQLRLADWEAYHNWSEFVVAVALLMVVIGWWLMLYRSVFETLIRLDEEMPGVSLKAYQKHVVERRDDHNSDRDNEEDHNDLGHHTTHHSSSSISSQKKKKDKKMDSSSSSSIPVSFSSSTSAASRRQGQVQQGNTGVEAGQPTTTDEDEDEHNHSSSSNRHRTAEGETSAHTSSTPGHHGPATSTTTTTSTSTSESKPPPHSNTRWRREGGGLTGSSSFSSARSSSRGGHVVPIRFLPDEEEPPVVSPPTRQRHHCKEEVGEVGEKGSKPKP